MTDAELAARLARAAGRVLLAIRDEGVVEGRALGDAGDRAADGLLMAALRAHRPDDGLLSEESADDLARLVRTRAWIVDPLDGTREYADGRDDWAVHVGLSIDGAPAVGAVALPARDVVLRTDVPLALPPLPEGAPRMVVSRTRCPPLCERVAERLGATLLPMGSAGAKAGAVLLGEAEIYLHAGGQREWDNCAPAAAALAAGLHASRVDGAALRYNRADTSVPDLLICRREWAEAVLDAVRLEREAS